MSLTIHGVCASPFVRKVMIVAETLGLEFDNTVIIPGQTPEGYEQLHPMRKIPAISDGDLNLADSSVICDYLVNRYGNSEFYPADPVLRAKALWLEEYADTRLLEHVGAIFFERFARPMILQQPTDEERVAKILETLPEVLDYLESRLGDDDYMLGDELCIGDIAIGSQFVNGKYGKVFVDEQKWPKLAAYVARLHALPCFAKRMAADQVVFANAANRAAE